MAYTTINKSSEHFNTKLYTGTGSTQSITGVGFQPDLVWVKDRDVTHWHTLTDIVRGTTKVVYTNSDTAEVTLSNGITSFDSDGFTTGSEVKTNNNGDNFVSWNWLGANGTASNTDGSITSTVSANTTSGFSIVKYTGNGTSGATIGHGLSSVPKVMFIRTYDAAAGFQVYHVATGNTKFAGYLNATDAAGTTAGAWNNTTPTSSVFTVGNGGNTNTNGGTHIAYVFAEKKGFSKFGSYTGNSNTDGTFVYTGFKPAWIMTKKTSGTSDWFILDNKRDTFNVASITLSPNNNTADNDQDNVIDFLSNGFKLRTSYGGFNDGGSYIYMAFAKAPLVGTNNIPATAR